MALPRGAQSQLTTFSALSRRCALAPSERSRSKRTGVYDVTVRNQQGECVALFRGRSHQIGGSITAAP